MGRAYAGVFGPLALAVVIVRSLVLGGEIEPVLMVGWMALLIFATAGYAIGRVAESIVDESVNNIIRIELETRQKQSTEDEQTAATT